MYTNLKILHNGHMDSWGRSEAHQEVNFPHTSENWEDTATIDNAQTFYST